MSRRFLCNTVEWRHGKPSSLSRFQNVRFDPFPLGCPECRLLSYSPWSRLRWWISHRLPHASSRIGSNLYAWRITLSDKINFVRFRYMGDGRGRKIDNVNPSISYHRRSTYERIPCSCCICSSPRQYWSRVCIHQPWQITIDRWAVGNSPPWIEEYRIWPLSRLG